MGIFKKQKPKKPEELGIKIGTPEQALWNGVRLEALALIKSSKNNLIVQEAMLQLAEQKLKELEK